MLVSPGKTSSTVTLNIINCFEWNNSFQYQQTDEFYHSAVNYTLEKSDTEGRNNLYFRNMSILPKFLLLMISHKKEIKDTLN